MFFLTGIAITIFLFILLLLKRRKSHADHILMYWMAAMAFHQVLFYIGYSGGVREHPHLMGLALPWPTLHGPFLFLYVTAMTREKPLKIMGILPHFLPFLILVALATPFYLLPAADKLAVYDASGKGYEWYTRIQMFMIMATGIGYVTWSLIRIHRHRARIRHWFSNAEKMSLRWLEYLAIGLGAIWILVIFSNEVATFYGVVILVLFIGLFGITQVPVFYSHPDILITTQQKQPASFDDFVSPTESTGADPVRYAKSGLKEDEAADLHARLTGLMQTQRLYTRNDITLADLAVLLDTHPNYLSQVINEREQKNFYHYINTLRVQAFLDATRDPAKKHYSILALAFECGFNSKSTFNKYFKAVSGKTPSEYFSEQNA